MDGTILADVGDGRHTGHFGREVADELTDPITAALLYAQTCAHWLGGDATNLAEASNAAAGAVKALKRLNGIIDQPRSTSRTPPGQALI